MKELSTWKARESRLENFRKNAIERGASSEKAIADTELEQKRNNRVYDRITGHKRGSNIVRYYI